MTDEPTVEIAFEPGRCDKPIEIPAELPVLPLRDTVLFPNSFMPLAVAREASVRLIDEATTSGPHDRRVHPARSVDRGAAAGRSLHDRHRHPHPQDVQAARRQPAPDRPGAGAGPARPDRRRPGRTSRPPSPRPTNCCATRTTSRSTRCSATSRATSSRWCRSRRCCPTTCSRLPPTSPTPASSPTSSPRA